MTLPAFLFGFLISTLYGAFFHLWKDGGPGRLFLYVVLSWAGFWAGHSIGAQIGWGVWQLGPLRFGMASLGSVLFLFIGHWLSKVKVDKPS